MDDEEYDEEDDFAEFESILKAIRTCLHGAMLKWYYRSRHESLIAFSNSRFYEYELKTFLCSDQEHPNLGVKSVCVENGIYDAGRTRTNQAEAERISELVLEHWQRFGLDKSLGVVTLNRKIMKEYLQGCNGRSPNHKRLMFQPIVQTAGYLEREYQLPNGTGRLGIGNAIIRPTPTVFIVDVVALIDWLKVNHPEMEVGGQPFRGWRPCGSWSHCALHGAKWTSSGG